MMYLLHTPSHHYTHIHLQMTYLHIWQPQTLSHTLHTDNNIGDEGAAAIADALTHNKTLTELHVQSMSFVCVCACL